MKKSDLKNGMAVEIEIGWAYIVIGDLLVSDSGKEPLANYNEDLTHRMLREFNINKVYGMNKRFGKGFNDYLNEKRYKEELLWEREVFVPRLISHNGYENENEYRKLGIIGTGTGLTALFGEKLYVGDVVECYDTEDRLKFKAYVCEDEEDNEYYVMGLRFDTHNLKNGIADTWQIRKVKSHKELTHKEEYDGVIAVLQNGEEYGM